MAAAEQAEDFCLPDEFLDEEMFLAAEKHTPAGAAAKDEDGDDDYIGDLSRRMTISFITDDEEENYSPSAVESINPKVMRLASSPQSTLCRTTSPNIPSQLSSPPSTPSADESEDDALELFYSTAGEIAAGVGFQESQWRRQWMPPVPCGEGALVMAQRKLAARHLAQSAYYASAAAQASSIQQIQLFQRLRQEQLIIKQHRSVAWSKQSRDRGTAVYLPGMDCRTYNNLGLPSSALHPLQDHYQPRRHTYPHHTLGSAGMRAMSLNCSGRESTGTGVFIPRSGAAGNPSDSTKKKSGCSTMPVLTPRNVGRATNVNPDELDGHLRWQYPSAGFPPCYEIDRNLAAFSFVRSDFPGRIADGGHYSRLHGRKELLRSHAAVAVDDNRLPTEWSY